MSTVFGQLIETAAPSRWRAAIVRHAFVPFAILADVAVIVASAGLTGLVYHAAVYGALGGLVHSFEVGGVAAVTFVLPNIFRGEYALANYFSFKTHVRRSIYLWNVTFLCLLALGFVAKVTDIYSRGAIVLFYFAGFPTLALARYALVRAVVAGSKIGLVTAQRVFLVGGQGEIAEFQRRYQPWDLGLRVVGSANLTLHPVDARRGDRDRTLRAELARAINAARVLHPDAVFVVVPWSDSETIDLCVEELLAIPAEIHLGPERILDRFDHVRISKLGRIASVQLTRKPLSPFEVLQKRAFDLIVAAGLLVALAPFLAAIAVLIRLDSAGPVFFLQRRFGFNQRPFRIIKFRTMRVAEDGEIVVQATHNDRRITRVGRWLRRCNLDELPQLLNVLKGDMSLVGPRPHALAHNREYEQKISFYARRHNVKPGITGWAQVNGLRGETDTDKKMLNRVEHDLYYIENWSMWFDLRILVRTVLSRHSYRNAH